MRQPFLTTEDKWVGITEKYTPVRLLQYASSIMSAHLQCAIYAVGTAPYPCMEDAERVAGRASCRAEDVTGPGGQRRRGRRSTNLSPGKPQEQCLTAAKCATQNPRVASQSLIDRAISDINMISMQYNTHTFPWRCLTQKDAVNQKVRRAKDARMGTVGSGTH